MDKRPIMNAGRSWHIFCVLVDNHGDIGVCWRLARQLAAEYGQRVTLWVDLWAEARAVVGLPPEPTPVDIAGVTVAPSSLAGALGEADVVVEGFGCVLPEAVRAQIAARARKPLLVDLEYFSAEPWVPSFHLGSSLDAEMGARRWFFFPGPGAGGMLRERGLLEGRNAWQADPRQAAALLARLGVAPRADALRVLCFAYAQAPYAEWVQALARAGRPVSIWLCGAFSQAALTGSTPLPGVTLSPLPFVPQDDFDRLLWSADLLWVRGEDSMVRALWSGRPFVWHIYPQTEGAHERKLMAWLDVYCDPFPAPLRAVVVGAHRAWNGLPGAPRIGPAWEAAAAKWQLWQEASRARADALAADPDLSARLIGFAGAGLAS